jgi:hypothetical protein
MNPAIIGPMTGPKNGLAEKNAMGVLNDSPLNMSDTLPPATERNAEPDTPERKRPMSQV